MAFFTRTQMTVPFLPDDENPSSDNKSTDSNEESRHLSSNESNNQNFSSKDKDSDSIGDKEKNSPYKYVVDRTLGVEVWESLGIYVFF